jgi:hypothetical protein
LNTQQPENPVHLIDCTGEMLVPISLEISAFHPHENKATHDQQMILLSGVESTTKPIRKIAWSKHHDTPHLG